MIGPRSDKNNIVLLVAVGVGILELLLSISIKKVQQIPLRLRHIWNQNVQNSCILGWDHKTIAAKTT